MQRFITYFWLVITLGLFLYFGSYYKVLPLRSKITLGIAMLVAAMLYSYRSALRKRQRQKQQKEKEDSR